MRSSPFLGRLMLLTLSWQRKKTVRTKNSYSRSSEMTPRRRKTDSKILIGNLKTWQRSKNCKKMRMQKRRQKRKAWKNK